MNSKKELVNGYSELKELIKDKGYNFLAVAITPWHLKGVLCALLYLRSIGKSISGVLCIMEHNTSGIVVEANLLDELSDNIDIYYYKENKASFAKNVKKVFQILVLNIFNSKIREQNFFLVTAGGYNHMLQREIEDGLNYGVCNIIYDEGIQTYLKPFKHEKVDFLSYIEYKLKRCLYFLMDLTKKRENDIFLTLFKPVYPLEENSVTIELYKQVLKEETIEITKDKKKLYENAIVINLQTFYDSGEVKGVEDLDIILNIIKICKKYKKKIVVKLHPRDMHKERYSCFEKGVIDGENISQESIINSLDFKPCLMIGFTTTTLLTAKLFWDINTISISGILKKVSLSKKLDAHISDFKNTFKNIIEFADDYEEFELKLLKMIK